MKAEECKSWSRRSSGLLRVRVDRVQDFRVLALGFGVLEPPL